MVQLLNFALMLASIVGQINADYFEAFVSDLINGHPLVSPKDSAQGFSTVVAFGFDDASDIGALGRACDTPMVEYQRIDRWN